MKKILSLFATIALLMVSFTGCQNMADIHIDPFEENQETKLERNVTLDYCKNLDLKYTVGEPAEIFLPQYSFEAGFTDPKHQYIEVTFVDANTNVDLDVPYTVEYDETYKKPKVYFTMPDADIILYTISIESTNNRNNVYEYARIDNKFPTNSDGKFKLVYAVKDKNYLNDSFRDKFIQAKRLLDTSVPQKSKDCWFYELTGWIDSKSFLYDGVKEDDSYCWYFRGTGCSAKELRKKFCKQDESSSMGYIYILTDDTTENTEIKESNEIL